MPETTAPVAYLLDLDGTLYAGGAAVPGAPEMLDRLRREGPPFRLVTNTTSRSRAMLVDRLRGYGFRVPPEEIFSATLAGAALARELGYRSLAPFLPAPALDDLAGFQLVGGVSGRRGVPDAVILGDLGEGWSYAVLQEAFQYVMGGAAIIALSRDRYWQRGDGLALDAGPFVRALEYATGRTAVVVGKPDPAFYRAAVDGLGLEPGQVVMVGDDVRSDVAGAQRAGLAGVLVRTGKFSPADLTGDVSPDAVLDSVADLPRWWTGH